MIENEKIFNISSFVETYPYYTLKNCNYRHRIHAEFDVKMYT